MGADIPEEESCSVSTRCASWPRRCSRTRRKAAARARLRRGRTLLAAGRGRRHGLSRVAAAALAGAGVLFVALKVVRLLLRPGVKVTVEGVEHFPGRGPYLICPNHQSYLDPFFVMAALPYRLARQMFFVGASEYFETSITRWLARQVNLVPVDPDAALVSAMQAGAAGLREGRILVLFPEGERSIDGTVRNFKKGAAILGHNLGVPIVPVALTGVFELWPRNRPLNWRALLPGAGSVVRLRVGPPIRPDGAGAEEATYAATTARLRDAVATMFTELNAPGRSGRAG